ncbi:MAG: hypothetical protein H6708_30125 [Kofleriaceae bacterium]|nr:hypothetical protein [Kofleriaceae bacterium]
MRSVARATRWVSLITIFVAGCTRAGEPREVTPAVPPAPATEPAPAEPPPAEAPVEPAPAAPAKPSGRPGAVDYRACTSSSDCMTYCPRVGRCCVPSACGCRNAINKAHKDDFDADFARQCAERPECPKMGCIYQRYEVACRDGQCVAVEEPDF